MNQGDQGNALVLFSGGQDSTVCLAWALERFASVETVGFDYGQRHRAELEVRPRIRERMQALRSDWGTRLGEDHIVKLDALAAISETALTLGMDRRVVIHTPLMWIDKAATFAMAHEVGGSALVDVLVEETHTCYLGDRSRRHPWGYGCGTCPACRLRADGFAKWKG